MSLRKRIKSRLIPQWDGVMESTAYAMCLANEWRVQPEFDIDDLMQESQLLFWIISVKYRTENDKHRMALLTKCVSNMITRLANKRTSMRKLGVCVSVIGDDCDLDRLPGKPGEISDSDLNIMLEEAPPMIADLCSRFVGVAKKPKRRRTGPNRIRETNNQYLCNVLGLNPQEVDVNSRLLSFVSGENHLP